VLTNANLSHIISIEVATKQHYAEPKGTAFFICVKAILQEMQPFLSFLLLNGAKIYVIILYINITL
jgi:hypothetical protein